MADTAAAATARRREIETTVHGCHARRLCSARHPSEDIHTQSTAGLNQPSSRIEWFGVDEGWLYLADVLDIGSRRVIGYAMAERMPTALVADAMEMAITARGGNVHGMVFHTDHGSQYLSGEFRRLCSDHGIVQSVGKTGCSADNALAESFWATLKRELVRRYRFETRAQARRAIITWIHRYNTVRLHSALGNVPPIEWELRYAYRQLTLSA